jgi:NAD(P)H dehydrogenase (quinone)
MITVTGAASSFGFQIIKELIGRGVSAGDIIAVSHDVPVLGGSLDDVRALGVPVRDADLTNPAGLTEVFAGTTQLMLVPFAGEESLEPVTDAALVRNRNALDATRAAGATWVGYISGLGAQDVNAGIFAAHRATEDLIRASWPSSFTFLRSGLQAERYTSLRYVGGLDDRKIFSIAGNGEISAVARFDLATAAAEVVVGDGLAGAAFDLVGEEPFGVPAFAATLTDVSGEAIDVVELSEDDYRQFLTNFGTEDVEATLALELATRDNQLRSDSKDLRTLIGRTPLTVPQALADFLGQIAGANE